MKSTKMKYQDKYEVLITDKDEFENEIIDRENNTKRIRLDNDSVEFYAIYIDESGNICGKRIVDDEKITTKVIQYADEDSDNNANGINRNVWLDTIKFGSGLAIYFKTIEERESMCYPVSCIAKLSLHNRSGVSFVGELNQNFSKISLAKLYEDFITTKAGVASTAIIVYDKMQALMSSRYSPISQNTVFDWVEEKLTNDNSGASFKNGYVSHAKSLGSWDYAEKNNVILGITVSDSSTGYSGIIVTPYVKIIDSGKGIHFGDKEWYSRHINVTFEDVEDGINAIYLESENIAKLLLETKYIQVNNPQFYAENVFEVLNSLAGRMHSAKLLDEVKKSVMQNVGRLVSTKPVIKVWDIVEIFWDIPNSAQSDAYKKNLQKTVSRILSLDHSKYDVPQILGK